MNARVRACVRACVCVRARTCCAFCVRFLCVYMYVSICELVCICVCQSMCLFECVSVSVRLCLWEYQCSVVFLIQNMLTQRLLVNVSGICCLTLVINTTLTKL